MKCELTTAMIIKYRKVIRKRRTTGFNTTFVRSARLIHIDLLMGVQAEGATTYNLRVTTRREQQSHVIEGKMLTDPVLQVSL